MNAVAVGDPSQLRLERRLARQSDGQRGRLGRLHRHRHAQPAFSARRVALGTECRTLCSAAAIDDAVERDLADASVTDLSRMGALLGVEAIEPSSGWQVSPYALARYSNIGAGAAQAGIDVRYAISPELAASITVNPDFAEAEVDAQQINLTPYALFKPEKRAFFLDGSNQFTFASGLGYMSIPFYSRTIGLVDGYPVRIDDGVKSSGRQAPGRSVRWACTVGILP